MNVVDSSGWIEYFMDGAGADFFEQPIIQTAELIVPAICLFEVYRLVLRERGEEEALEVVSQMRSGRVIELDANLAISAAALAHENKLAMADSIILATAMNCDAILWTQDADLSDFPDVRYHPKVHR